jgi:hypothetical protein
LVAVFVGDFFAVVDGFHGFLGEFLDVHVMLLSPAGGVKVKGRVRLSGTVCSITNIADGRVGCKMEKCESFVFWSGDEGRRGVSLGVWALWAFR